MQENRRIESAMTRKTTSTGRSDPREQEDKREEEKIAVDLTADELEGKLYDEGLLQLLQRYTQDPTSYEGNAYLVHFIWIILLETWMGLL